MVINEFVNYLSDYNSQKCINGIDLLECYFENGKNETTCVERRKDACALVSYPSILTSCKEMHAIDPDWNSPNATMELQCESLFYLFDCIDIQLTTRCPFREKDELLGHFCHLSQNLKQIAYQNETIWPEFGDECTRLLDYHTCNYVLV
ncbi:hypothetical protein M3Y97_00865400 [Aphelenchoides bicaudatus]|nr:hypothetical protein M3Y97_00865400 [Aphelenchoides bicaudatus]